MSGRAGDYDLNDKVTSIIVRRKQPVRVRVWKNENKDGWVCSFSAVGRYTAAMMRPYGFLPNEATLVQVEGTGYIVRLFDGDINNSLSTIIRPNQGVVNLNDRGFDNKMNSMEILLDNTGRFPDTGQGSVTLYEGDPIDDSEFIVDLPLGTGSYTFPQLRLYGFTNEKLTQVRVNSDLYEVQLYMEDNFQGRNAIIRSEDGLISLKRG